MTPHPEAPRAEDERIEGLPNALNARRLLWIRMIAVPGSVLCLLLAQDLYGLSIKTLPLASILGLLVLYNLWVWWRLKTRVVMSDREIFMHMIVDLLALSSILYYTGGAANPFVFFFMLPMVVTAAALPRIYTWFMALASAVCYTLLLLFRVEVPELVHRVPGVPVDLHVVGMWVGFVIIAALVAYFVSGMAETVRERDRYLAELREHALRDEKVVAMATLAAGAAHELSTPLATMAVLTGEMAAEYPADRHRDLHRQLSILREQIGRCKEALSVLSASAGAARADSAAHQRLDEFVASVVAEVCRLRPGARVSISSGETGSGSPPSLVIERTVRQALLNVLHNAVDASPGDVRVECTWSDQQIELSVTDRGGGLLASQAGKLGRPQESTKEGGLGLGLFLSQAAMHQFGGRLLAEPNDAGGTTVRLHLPLNRLLETEA